MTWCYSWHCLLLLYQKLLAFGDERLHHNSWCMMMYFLTTNTWLKAIIGLEKGIEEWRCDKMSRQNAALHWQILLLIKASRNDHSRHENVGTDTFCGWRVTMRPDLGETRTTHKATKCIPIPVSVTKSLVKTRVSGEYFCWYFAKSTGPNRLAWLRNSKSLTELASRRFHYLDCVCQR